MKIILVRMGRQCREQGKAVNRARQEEVAVRQGEDRQGRE